jgi:methylated-DNA-protein-cysteine methyltransferase-like protein
LFLRNKLPSPFTKKTIDKIRSIPRGMVATYGQIAMLSGNPAAARQIVRILHIYFEKEELPWHRVVNRFGKISLKDHQGLIQKDLLKGEGVVFDGGDKIDLAIYLWKP